jgi:signal transduction histidine kinase/ActR/RegA family two-component response regulator
VSTSAQAIRSERYAEIGAVIGRDAGVLLDRWARRATEEQPNAKRVHHDVLLDDLTGFLHELAEHLASDAPSDRRHCRSAREHGGQRWQTGWSLAEVVRDYRILRLVVLEHLDDTLDRPLRLRESQAVGLALDDAIEASVERYVLDREEQLRRLQDNFDAEHRRVAEEQFSRQAAALRAADRRKNEFLATLAHELRNPLSPLRNALEAVRLDGDSPSAIREVREMMDRQVRLLSRLVDDLLDVARIAEGKISLLTQRVDLRATLEQAAQMNAPLVEARRHQLTLDIPKDQVCVEGDPARLLQVFVNLLNNAAKYTPEGGQLTLALAVEDNQAVVRVGDNGVGIPPAMLAEVFDLFTQLDVGPERPQGGLGIGLTLVKRLIELHGGTIAAASPGEVQGSEFSVRLAALPGEGVGQERDCVSSAPSLPRNILIIEDNTDSRESLARLLRLKGHTVFVAADGREGLAVAVRDRPDVALVDIGLPDVDGYRLASQLRSQLGPATFLAALTGHGQPEDRERALGAGFDAHVTKPVELDVLEALLAQSLPSHPSPGSH